MSELEPNDSRDVTLTDERAPGEPPRTGPREGETRGQSQNQQQGGKKPSNWREAEQDRDAQDHEFAGGIDAPSLRPEADDGQWSQLAQDEDEPIQQATQEAGHDAWEDADVTRPMGWRDHVGSALRGASYEQRQREQAERGGS